ncbi:MAG: hypothetical protein GXP23_12745 [Gammaproteobacteria bacterium]|nr:hypothetical protein [Gammaproteobacteria bacterium]
MYGIKTTLIFLTLALLPGVLSPVYAETQIQTLELPLGDITLKPGTALKLKALALKANPEMDINKAQLLAIEVLAKSRQGQGMMRLRIGNDLTPWTKATGTQKKFDSNESNTFSTIKIRSPEEGKGKVWQLLINGYIKIRKVILYTIQETAQSVKVQNDYHRLQVRDWKHSIIINPNQHV